MVRVSAIIAAYNEESTVANVVRTFKSSPLIGEVIVVSDGSIDKTAERAREAGADIVHELSVKRGKGEAISHGVTHSDGEILFFADADLRGFSPEHIEKILQPVLKGKLQMSVGLRDRGIWQIKMTAHLPLISGERALRRTIFLNIPTKYLRGFMLEAALNYYCRSRRLPYGTVILPGLTIRRKMQKVGFWRGLGQYIKMGYQIVKAMIVVRAARAINKF